jgi:ammonium transporter, Amt family
MLPITTLLAVTMPTECTGGRDSSDVAWLLSSAVLVVSMQGGFALLEAGAVRATTATNIMLKNLADLILGGLIWWAVGWSFAFGSSATSAGIIGTGQFFGRNMSDFPLFFFQFSFAATTSTIDSGAVAERMKFIPYMALSTFMTAWTYPLVAHWVWGGGFMARWGFHDFAGSGVVHLVGGASALVAAMWLGPRRGRFPDVDVENGRNPADVAQQQSFQANDPPSQLFGTFLLFLGWLGFNMGSTLGLTDGGSGTAPFVAVNTMLAGCAGGLVGMMISYKRFKMITVEDTCNGIIGALVSVTASADVIHDYQAIIVGTLGSLLVSQASKFLIARRIDDPIGAVPVHGGCGMLALILAGLFSTNGATCGNTLEDEGLFITGRGQLIGIQLLCGLIIASWSALNTFLLLVFSERVLGVPVRVTADEEDAGLDMAEHGVDDGERIIQMLRQARLTINTLDEHEKGFIQGVMLGFMGMNPEQQTLKDKNLIKVHQSRVTRRSTGRMMNIRLADMHKSPSNVSITASHAPGGGSSYALHISPSDESFPVAAAGLLGVPNDVIARQAKRRSARQSGALSAVARSSAKVHPFSIESARAAARDHIIDFKSSEPDSRRGQNRLNDRRHSMHSDDNDEAPFLSQSDPSNSNPDSAASKPTNVTITPIDDM